LVWIVFTTALLAFAFGWVMHGWQCSRRRDCPLYAEQSLRRWKHDVEVQVARHGDHRADQNRPTPVDGVEK